MKYLIYLSIPFFWFSCAEESKEKSTPGKKEKPSIVANENVKGYVDPIQVLDDDEVYAFMNEVVLNDLKTNINFQLKTFSIQKPMFSFEMIERENSNSIKQEDLEFIYDQVDTTIFLWNCSRLKNINCLESHVVDSLFNLDKDFMGKTKEGMENFDPWNALAIHYGANGINSYSIPYFNKDKTLAVIQCNSLAHFTLGAGYLRIYQKKNGKWVFLKKYQIWMS